MNANTRRVLRNVEAKVNAQRLHEQLTTEHKVQSTGDKLIFISMLIVLAIIIWYLPDMLDSNWHNQYVKPTQ